MSNTGDEKVSIMIGSPMYGGKCHMNYVYAMLHLQGICAQHQIPIVYNFLSGESLITRGRNRIAYDFLNSSCTHLMWIDSDISFNYMDVFRLITSGKDFIGGVYPRKTINWHNVINAVKANPDITPEEVSQFVGDYVYTWLPNGLVYDDKPVEVLEIGTGFLLTHRSVYEKLIASGLKPHKEINGSRSGQFEDRYPFFETGPNDEGRYLSEDYWLCNQWRKIGGSVWMQPDINLSHIGDYTFAGNQRIVVEYQQKYGEKLLQSCQEKN